MLKLFDFFASGASYRVRIALNLKGLEYERAPINLRAEEQSSRQYLDVNPQGLVPTLETGDLRFLQSSAIIEWLDETYPDPPFLPGTADARATVRAVVGLIACDIHPLNNRRVLEHLRGELQASPLQVGRWCSTWIESGFRAIETILAARVSAGPYCFGVQPTLADIFLVPQVHSARRFGVDLSPFPAIHAIDEACRVLPPFAAAAPHRQPEYQP